MDCSIFRFSDFEVLFSSFKNDTAPNGLKKDTQTLIDASKEVGLEVNGEKDRKLMV
jgi:hypothetical protein